MSRSTNPWDIPDVPSLLEAIGRRIDVRAGLDIVVVVDTSDERTMIACEALQPLGKLSTSHDAWELARDTLEQVFIRLCPQRRLGDPAPCTVHLVRCRDGRVVPTPDQGAVGYAMLLANNPVQVYIGEVITVTPHGWRERHRGGLMPTLTSLRRAQLRPA